MNITRLAAALMLTVTLASCLLAYSSLEASKKVMAANRMLSEAIVNGDAMELDWKLDVKTGDILVRVNGNNKNMHIFHQVCPKQGVL